MGWERCIGKGGATWIRLNSGSIQTRRVRRGNIVMVDVKLPKGSKVDSFRSESSQEF